MQLAEASTQKSAMTHAGNVFLPPAKTQRTEKPAVGSSINRESNPA